MADTKTCRKCGQTKALDDFHKQPSNRDGRNTLCKPCLLRRNEPIQSGSIVCKTCGVEKSFREFTVQRTSRHGRSARCKECVNTWYVQRRHAAGPVLAPSSGRRAIGVTYVKRPCVVCGAEFEPKKRRQTWCTGCGNVWRDIHSHMSTTRGRHGRQRVSAKTARDVALRYIRADSCVYCGREFCEALPKSIDHVHPFCRGGGMDDAGNIEICCMQCNRSKASMNLEEWFLLCSLVAERLGGRFSRAVSEV